MTVSLKSTRHRLGWRTTTARGFVLSKRNVVLSVGKSIEALFMSALPLHHIVKFESLEIPWREDNKRK